MANITPTIFSALVTEEPRTPEFYLLPKIHKGMSPTPGCPIVSGNGCPTEKISAFVDYLIKPYVPHIRSLEKEITNTQVLELLKMVLTMNNFRFNGQNYLQVGGTAMGTRVAPTFANSQLFTLLVEPLQPASAKIGPS